MALASPPPRVPLVTLQCVCVGGLCCRVTLAGPSHGGPAAGWPVGATDGEMLRGTSPLRCDAAAGLMLPGCPPTLGCRRPHDSLSLQPCSAGSLPWSLLCRTQQGCRSCRQLAGSRVGSAPLESCVPWGPSGAASQNVLPTDPGTAWGGSSPALPCRAGCWWWHPSAGAGGTGAGRAGSCPCTHWGPGTGGCRTEAAGPRVPAVLGQGWGRAGTRG